VIGFVVIWVAAPTTVSAYDVGPPGQDTDFDLVDDYWPLANNGYATCVYASGALWCGRASDSGSNYDVDPAGWIVSEPGDLSWASEVDRRFIAFFNPIYGVWDLGEPCSEVVVFPVVDHNTPTHGVHFKLWGSNDFNASNPGAATWAWADLDTVYRKGWSPVGEGIYTICSDDYVSVWDWQPGSGAGDSYRFIKLQSIWGTPYNEPEIDAVKGVIGAGPGPGGPCDWQKTIVEKGKTFSYTSLATAWDEVLDVEKVHIAFGGEELYYALWDGYNWQEQEIESGGVGAYCSLALDNDNKPCISYYDATNGNLKYARLSGSKWVGMSDPNKPDTVDSVGDVGQYTSLAFDTSVIPWKPAISYYDATNGNLKYARWNGLKWVGMSDPNKPDTVDSAGDVGSYTSLAFDSGNPAISYYDATNGNLKYARWNCSMWGGFASLSTPDTVDSAGDVGRYTSLAFDGLGNPAISYYDATNGNLKYAHRNGARWIGADPSSLVPDTVDITGDVGWYTSLAFDSSDNPAISYYDVTEGDLKYAHSNGTTWDIVPVDLDGVVGQYTSLAFDSSDNPVISYYDATNDYVKYAYSDGTSWHKDIVYSISEVGRYTSLAFDSWGDPAISYYDVRQGDLQYAHRRDGSWEIETVDNSGDVGQYTSLAFDKGSPAYPAISYYDATNGDLKYARWDATKEKWVGAAASSSAPDRVDGVGADVGQYTSLAFDSSGKPAISYYDATNGNLKYARLSGSKWVGMSDPNKPDTVDSSGDVGRYTSLAFDSSGKPAISYYDATKDDLKYARWDATKGKWVGMTDPNKPDTVDSAGDVGSYTSLAFDSLDNPAISYHDATNGDLKYAYWTCCEWHTETVDSEGLVGTHTSLAFDGCCGTVDNPAISYYDATNGTLKYARRDATNGTWVGAAASSSAPDTVDDDGWAGWYTSLAFTTSGTPAISYQEATHNDLRYIEIPTECGPCPPPDQPTNVCPQSGESDVSLTPSLCSSAFSHPGRAEGCEVVHIASQWQITAICGDYSSPVFDSGRDTAHLICISIPFGELSYSTTYYWRVRHEDDCHVWSDWSEETCFTTGCATPGMPSNPSPENHATGVLITADLEWSVCSNTDSYDVYFGTSATPPLVSGDQEDNTYDPALSYGTHYYWKIVAKNDCGNSTPGPLWDFRTETGVCPTPGTPDNPSPADGETDVSINADLDWSDCVNTDFYDVYFGTSSSFVGKYDSTSSSRYTLPPLQSSKTYYWKIVAKNDCGGSTPGAVWEFTTAPYGAPHRPTNICPTPGSTGISLTPTLMSSDFSDPDPGDTHAASQWQIRTSTGNYTAPVWDSDIDTENLTSISVPSGELDYYTTYYFQVAHQDNHGNWSSWSAETFFTTHRAPRQPSNISPEDEDTGVSLTPTLVSSGFSDPDGDFHAASWWQIATDDDFTNMVYDSGASSKLTQITIPSGELSYGTTYYWRVRHEDHLGGLSAYSSETSFTTVSAPPLQADFDADETAVVVGEGVQFTSRSSGGVPSLSYQWDFDNNGTWDDSRENPSYAYAAAGNYTVVLKVTDSTAHTDTERKLKYITVYAPPEADFTADETAVVAGESVQFTSLSSGGMPPLSYQWDFDNDGTWDDIRENPSCAYPVAGNYTVVLKVTDSAANTDTETKTDYITVTAAPLLNQPPDQPSNVSPADEATGVSLTPPLESSAFSDPDEGDTHAASQWRIKTSTGDYLDPVWDSDRDTDHLTSIPVPSGELDYNTTYCFQVRHQDDHGDWSSWSVETRFTTKEAVGLPFWVWIAIGVGAAVILVAGVIFGRRRGRTIMSKALGTVFYT